MLDFLRFNTLTVDFLQEDVTKLMEWNEKWRLQSTKENGKMDVERDIQQSSVTWETFHYPHRGRERLGCVCYQATSESKIHASHSKWVKLTH